MTYLVNLKIPINPGLGQAGISKRGFDETSSPKPSSGDGQFSLAGIDRNIDRN
jgi:hypothetical protein